MLRKWLLGLVLICLIASGYAYSQQQKVQPVRDANALDILSRVVNAAGGAQALVAVRDLTETGNITFNWGDGVTAPVTIKILSGNYFRMEADLPDGPRIWNVENGVGWRKQYDHLASISNDKAVNLENLTYPLREVAAALADPTTAVSLVGIETLNSRSIYRVRLKGRLGLTRDASPVGPTSKDLLIDALTFDILAVNDFPFFTYQPGGKRSDVATRMVTFEDFKIINGIRIPFSISTKVLGQPTSSISLSEITFNSNLSDADFAQ